MMKLSEIVNKTQRRAKKITNDRALYFLNYLIHNDILTAVYATYPEYFKKKTDVPIVQGTTEYDMPSDYGMVWEIRNISGGRLYREDGVYVSNKKLYVPADTKLTKVVVHYYRPLPTIDANTDIDLPDDILNDLIPIYVAGIEYYFFSDNKKTQETSVSFNRYLDARKNILTYSIGSLI